MDLSLYDEMTNDEIRRRLVNDFHQSCGPIVATTRKLFIKKLARLESESGDYSFNLSLRGDDSVTNGVYSTNGNETKNKSKLNQSLNVIPSTKRKNAADKIASSARKSLPASVPQIQISQKNETSRQKVQTKKTLPVNISTPPTPQKPAQQRPRSVTPKGKIPSPVKERSSPKRTLVEFNESRITNVSDSDEDEESLGFPLESTAITESSPRPRFRIPKTLGKFSPKNFFSSSSQPAIVVNRKSVGTPLARPPLQRNSLLTYSDSESETEDIQNSERMTKILLNHRPVLGQNRYVKQSPNFTSRVLSFFSGLFGTNNSRKAKKSTRADERDNFTQSSNNVSRFLLHFVVVFFISIVGLYFGLKFYNQKTGFDLTDYSFIEDRSQLIVPVCGPNVFSNCLSSEKERVPALNIVRDIRSYIDSQLISYLCENSNPFKDLDTFFFTPVDLKKNLWDKLMNTEHYKVNGIPNYELFLRDFKNACMLIGLNPNWNMAVDPLNGDLSVNNNYSANFTFACQVKLVALRNLYYIVTFFLTSLTLYFSVVYRRHSKKKAYEEQSEVDRLIEESMELLQSPDEPLSIPVLHIRDTLIPTSDRKSSKYKKIWSKVVSHMENSESRVKVEFSNVDGEDFKAWKWIGGGNTVGNITSGLSSADESDLDSTNNPEQIGGLKWQGTAFSQINKKSTSKNNTTESKARIIPALTCFMKVRNYYDKSRKYANPNYQQLIRNSIIEKVIKEKGTHDILHIGLNEDEKESLIYIKCKTLDGATDVFSALHGWWCENRLVSVKYLKEERYYQHFPEAVNAKVPLQVE